MTKYMSKRFCIEKDNILKQYIVWENHKSLKIEVYRDRLKKNCKNFLEKEVKHDRMGS